MSKDRELLKVIMENHKDYGFKKSELQYKIISSLYYNGKIQVGGRMKSMNDPRVQQIINILKNEKIKFRAYNDSPRGGISGDYLGLTDKNALKEIAEEKNALLNDYIMVSFKTWKLQYDKYVSPVQGDKAYDYLMKFYNHEVEINNTQSVEDIAENLGVPVSAALTVAVRRYKLHLTHSSNGVYERMKESLNPNIPVEKFISVFDNGGYMLYGDDKKLFDVENEYAQILRAKDKEK